MGRVAIIFLWFLVILTSLIANLITGIATLHNEILTVLRFDHFKTVEKQPPTSRILLCDFEYCDVNMTSHIDVMLWNTTFTHSEQLTIMHCTEYMVNIQKTLPIEPHTLIQHAVRNHQIEVTLPRFSSFCHEKNN